MFILNNIMTTDISTIKNELKGFEEVEMPYIFIKGEPVKYITMSKYDDELFYTGGDFVRMGNERIVINNGGSEWSFQTKIRNNQNDITYKSRIFVKKDYISDDSIEVKEYQKIVETQQKIINTLSRNFKTYENKLVKEMETNDKLKQIILNLKGATT